MEDESNISRANLLAQMADSPSVTTDVLADQERRFEAGRLAGEPPVAHLEETEAPAFVLTNSKKGIGLGSKRKTTSPDGNRGSVFLVTDRRTLCLIGTEAGDQEFSIPHDAVAAVSGHSGLLSNRLELRTPRKAYHCWAERSTPDSLLTGAVEFVTQRMQDEPEELEGDDDASLITYRGGTVTRDSSGSGAAAPGDDG
jgi:hypothetical protein